MPDNPNNPVPRHPLEPFFLESRLARIDNVLSQRSYSTVVVLDGVSSEHNISAVLRSADAFGLQKIFIVGPQFSHTKGISMGVETWLTVKRMDTATEVIHHLKESGYKIALLQSQEISQELGKPCCLVQDLPFKEKIALVFGNEKRGVSEEFQNAASYFAYIPMVGFVESLNISVAAALTFYTALIQGRPVISEQEQQELKGSWLEKDLRGGAEILKRVTAKNLPPKSF
jgi:tRNA (guanosine-2'-O-)-methyltransferase